MIKPDGVQRGLVGEIIKRFEQKGYQLVALKMTMPGKEHMELHYEDLKDKKFFPSLIAYMTSGPVVAMVWEVRCIGSRVRVLLVGACAARQDLDSLVGVWFVSPPPLLLLPYRHIYMCRARTPARRAARC
jgi:nucleoside diphosphate kinase